MSPVEQKQIADRINRLDQSHDMVDRRIRTAVGAMFLGGAAVTGAVLMSGTLQEDRFVRTVPYNEQAQEIVNQVDDVLAAGGAIALVGGMMLVGGTKIAARFDHRIKNADKHSSQEATDDGKSSNSVQKALRTVTRSTFAGSIPIVVAAASGLGTLTAAIGTEVTEGPDRPVRALESLAPGAVMITQDAYTNPMQNSVLTSGLVANIMKESSEREVPISASPVSLGLGNTIHNDQTLTSLLVGVPTNQESMLHWEAKNCTEKPLPVVVDEAAEIAIGSDIEINGVSAEVVGKTESMSAMNRIGIMMSQTALNQCQEKNVQNPSDFIVLDTDLATAQDILSKANSDEETATVITREQYIANNQKFWEANVQPITNTMALLSFAFAGVAMSGSMTARIMRNRRELGAKLAAGYSARRLQFTETLRATKDGILGWSLGTIGVTALAPAVNMLESGMKVGVGVKEALVGASVGIIGSVGGALIGIARPRKMINPSESTRV